MRYNYFMRFEVPQFIEIEDKIIGPLTWRQFIYIAGGVGLLLILYFSPLPKIFFVFLGIPLGGLAFSLAFHKVNNRPFSIFLESLINYTRRKKLYLWRKDEVQTITGIPEIQPQIPKNISEGGGKSINSLSHKLENHILE